MKIYVASSWRNEYQQNIVRDLRAVNHDVYDFRNPQPGDHGFSWLQIDPFWLDWDGAAFREALKSPQAEQGFKSDKTAMDWADACVLALPCGKSAHLEAGYMAGQGKKVAVLLAPGVIEPELMYKLLGQICLSLPEVVDYLENP